jgi:hypothetical protein
MICGYTMTPQTDNSDIYLLSRIKIVLFQNYQPKIRYIYIYIYTYILAILEFRPLHKQCHFLR